MWHHGAGLCCGVDQGANRMFPGAVQSSRAGSVFKHMSVESTGTASFTFFAPIGCKTNITAFHQETKKRRSWNCGTEYQVAITTLPTCPFPRIARACTHTSCVLPRTDSADPCCSWMPVRVHQNNSLSFP